MKTGRRFTSFILVTLLVVASFGVHGSGRQVFGADLGETTAYIVGFEEPKIRSLGKTADPMAALDIQPEKTYTLIDAAKVELTQSEAVTLANQPGVAYVEPDYPVYALSQSVPWGVDRIYEEENYPFATWSSTSGAGIRIAVLDTGIQADHEDLLLAGGVNTVDRTDWGVDGNGHGTHVAGIIAAQVNTIGVVGVAPAADLYAAKVLKSDGRGYTSDIIEAIEWAVANDMNIISMSLGTTTDSISLKNACDNAYDAGLLIVAAAGNSGKSSGLGNNMEYPAKYASVIAIGASNEEDDRADFSSTGTQLELMAPGASILSTYPNTTLSGGVTVTAGTYQHSFSTAVILGSAAGTVSAPIVDCGLANNAGAVAAMLLSRNIGAGDSWIALIERGDDTFSEKVSLVMDLGASAAIIINNDSENPNSPGNFSLFATEADKTKVWIPTVSISYNSGQMIDDRSSLSGTVDVGYNPYKTMSGTSMATPHAAAAAAIVWAAAPELTNVQLRQVLGSSALDLGLDPTQQGQGLIQLNAALDLAAALASGPVVEVLQTIHDPAASSVQADLKLLVPVGTHATLVCALYDASGRMRGLKLETVDVTALGQSETVTILYTDTLPATLKTFVLDDTQAPLGKSVQTPLL